MKRTRFPLRRAAALVAALCVAMLSTVSVQAVSYQYDKTETAVAAPAGYAASAVARSSDLGPRMTWTPTDFCIDPTGEVHMLDQENGCVFVFDSDLRYRRTVVFREDGEEAFLAELNGICVRREGDGITYIVADTGNKRVFFADGAGNITREITRPDTAVFRDGTTFAPTKVGLDSSGNLYALVSSVYQGVCVFSAKDEYKFITFLGGNTVESTVTVLTDYFWKSVFGKRQIASMRRYIPVPVANFTIDDRDNLYTVTNKSASGTNYKNEIKRFNASNINTLKQQDWGDSELAVGDNYLYIDTSYVDAAVSADGLIAALDANLCRVAVFTAQGERLFTFGEKNQTAGTFDTPVAIDTFGRDLYVLDQHRQSVIRFSPTEYGALVLKAAQLHAAGKYDEAAPLWEQVSRRDGANLLAHVGLGKQAVAEGDYKAAMKQFREGSDRESYSYAFGLERSRKMQKIFPAVAVLMLAAFVFLLVLDRKLRGTGGKFVDPGKMNLAGKVRYTLFHPCEGGQQLARKTSAAQTVPLAVGIVVVWFLLSTAQWCFSGFIFNENDLSGFNLWLQLGKTVGLFLLWIASAWLVTNLMDSSARFTDLIVVTAVALIPYVLGCGICTVMSNCLVLEEQTYLTVIRVILLLWSFALLWGGMREINEMSFKASFACMLFTVFGMLLMLFMAILLWSLLQQVVSFAAQILTELRKMT